MLFIRPALSSEAGALAVVAWRAKGLWGYPLAVMEQWRAELTPSEGSITSSPTFAAEMDGEIAGWCQIAIHTVPIELEHMWVDPEFMNRGVGRALVTSVCEHLRSHNVRILAIDADPNAEPFYLRCGAVRVGEITAPIPENPNRVRPQLELNVFIQPATSRSIHTRARPSTR